MIKQLSYHKSAKSSEIPHVSIFFFVKSPFFHHFSMVSMSISSLAAPPTGPCRLLPWHSFAARHCLPRHAAFGVRGVAVDVNAALRQQIVDDLADPGDHGDGDFLDNMAYILYIIYIEYICIYGSIVIIVKKYNIYIYMSSQYMDIYIYMTWYMIYGDALFLGLPYYIWWEHFGFDMGKCWMGMYIYIYVLGVNYGYIYIMGCTNGDDLPTPYIYMIV